MLRFRYGPVLVKASQLSVGDGLIVTALGALLYLGVRLAFRAPSVIHGPEISLSLAALPWYALLSVGRMATAYGLALLFSLAYGYTAARNPTAEKIMIPVLDVLQSVPILSFLPVVLLGLAALLPQSAAAEVASIVLIFTSQAWNLTFCFYQAMTTLPGELREASAIFRLGPWLRLRTLELPWAALQLVWNSMMSWSGGWFFLMAAEIFHVGARDFRLRGLGSYMQVAADAGNLRAVMAGLVTLVLVIVLLDQVVWRPLLRWAEKFKLETVQGSDPPQSWFYDLLSRSLLVELWLERVWTPLIERLDRPSRELVERGPAVVGRRLAERSRSFAFIGALLGAVLLYVAFRAVGLLATLPGSAWRGLALGTLATFGRVALALVITLAWTIPVGVAIGTNRRMAAFLQPVVQVVASIPATAIFPILLLLLLRAPGGLNMVSVLLMLMGTQWYLLFNVIAGASAIPRDLRDTTELLRLSSWDQWRTLILPALFPYIVTGSITASGGAWNASIIAERVEFGGRTYSTVGVGALIAGATGRGDYPLLLAATLTLVVTVVLLNRQLWRRLYRMAEDRYRMD